MADLDQHKIETIEDLSLPGPFRQGVGGKDLVGDHLKDRGSRRAGVEGLADAAGSDLEVWSGLADPQHAQEAQKLAIVRSA